MTDEERELRLAALEAEVADLRHRLNTIGLVLRGSLVERWTRCGKRGCACQDDPPRLHGPYLQWTTKVNGRTKTQRLTKREAAAYETWIENGRRLDALIQEWEHLGHSAAELIRAN